MALAAVFALLAGFGFASGTILVRICTQRIAPATATFFGVLAGAIVIQVLAWSIDWSKMDNLSWPVFGWLVLMAALAYPLARVLNYTAVSMVGASRATPMGSIQPIFALVLSVIILGERPNLIVGLGTFAVVGGLVFVIKGRNTTTEDGSAQNLNNLGYFLAAGATATFAVRDIISRHVVSGETSPLIAAALALSIGAVMLFLLTHRDVFRSIRSVPMRFIWLCGIAGVLQGLAVTCVFLALSRAPVTSVSPIISSAPLMTLILAHIFLQRLERLNPMLVAGTALSVGGVVTVIVGSNY